MSTFDLNSIDEVITPCCDVEVKTSDIGDKLKCPACGMNLKQRIFLPVSYTHLTLPTTPYV